MADDVEIRAGRRSVRITHSDRVLFPADGITKGDLAAYYAGVADAMTPHVRDRPLNLWRWNAGIEGELVVQQQIPRGAPDWVRRVDVPKRGRGGGTVTHAVGGEAATLVWLANQNSVTIHAWNSRADRPDRPDRIVFDLDPPPDSSFQVVREAALTLGDVLRGMGLEPFAMVTGSKGIHVVAPLRRGMPADEVRERAGTIGEEVAAADPDRLTTAWRKEKRGGRVLVDTARNTYAQTVVAPYAVRALPGAPVATPLEWDELHDPGLKARGWTLRTIPDRLAEHGDPWAGMGRHARSLPRAREHDGRSAGHGLDLRAHRVIAGRGGARAGPRARRAGARATRPAPARRRGRRCRRCRPRSRRARPRSRGRWRAAS
jgi:bifunctional non-homologous end joining protein LigD